MSKKITLSELARRTNRTKQTISDLRNTGRITVEKVGGRYLVDYETALQEMRDNVALAKPVPVPGTATRSSPDVNPASLNALKQAKLALQVKRENLLVEQMEGKLVSKAMIDDALYKKARLIREAFQQIPAQVIDAVLASRNRTEGLNILINAIDEKLNEVADMKI